MYKKIFYSGALWAFLLFFTPLARCQEGVSVRYRASAHGVINFFHQRGFDFHERWSEFKYARKTLDEIKQEILDVCLCSAQTFQPSSDMTMWDILVAFFGPSQVVGMTPLNSPLHADDLIFFGRIWERSLEWSHPNSAEMRSFFFAVGLALGSLLNEIQSYDVFQNPELVVNNLHLGECFLYNISFNACSTPLDGADSSTSMLATRADRAVAVKEVTAGYQRVLYDEQTKVISYVNATFDECDEFLEELGAPTESLVALCREFFASCFCPMRSFF